MGDEIPRTIAPDADADGARQQSDISPQLASIYLIPSSSLWVAEVVAISSYRRIPNMIRRPVHGHKHRNDHELQRTRMPTWFVSIQICYITLAMKYQATMAPDADPGSS